jgi:CRISPR/Cas system CSM-associated protein Csm2 small subunit
MFKFPTETPSAAEPALESTKATATANKYGSNAGSKPAYSNSNEMNYSMIDELLETEKQRNKNEAWNKLDKTQKTLNLHAFAEKYGKEHGMPVKEIKHLKAFFSDCLDKAKLQKTKDVVYNKETREIVSIPALHFNTTTHAFTLKMLDTKRVSTLKSLTPKRISEKNKETVEAAL